MILSVVFTVTFGIMVNNSFNHNDRKLISPLVAETNASAENNSSNISQIFVNNYYGYKIKHPSEVQIKNETDGDVNLYRTKNINIEIVQETQTNNQSIDSIIENTINLKKDSLKDNFVLLNNPSPIALGMTTAQTFSSLENGENKTYYFVPQSNNKYLIITNLSLNIGSKDYLTSEDIIYSLELLP